jgi:hypothetical protein
MEITEPTDYSINPSKWWFVFNPQTSLLLFPPLQCSGKTSSPYNLVVCDTLQECEDYIASNNLKYPEEIQLPKQEPTNQE